MVGNMVKHVNICNNLVIPVYKFSGERRLKKKGNGFIAENGRYALARFYDTDIVVIDKRNMTITLNSGGHRTVTIKKLMNKVLGLYGVPISICQKKKEWLVVTGYVKLTVGYAVCTRKVFKDGMSVMSSYSLSPTW